MLAGKICDGISTGAVSATGIPEVAMTPDEHKSGTEILAALAHKYCPNVLGEYGLEATAIMVFGMYGFRVMTVTDMVIKEKIRMQEAEMKAQRERENSAYQKTADHTPTDIHFPSAVN